MLTIAIILAGVFLLVLLLCYIQGDNRYSVLPTKAALSSLFVITVLIQPHSIGGYYEFLLAGLVFCLLGDIFLALPQERMFLAGLMAFLAGHLLYIIGFYCVAKIGRWTGMGFMVIAAIGIMVYFQLRIFLGRMKVPVILYLIVISVMVTGAWSVFMNYHLAGSGRIMVLTGALLFCFSDLFVARNRFIKQEFSNRLIGLPLYYTGQFLLAFSPGFL